MSKVFSIKGNFFDCAANRKLQIRRNSYCIVKNGVSEGIFQEIPAQYAGIKVTDYGSRLIMPGLVDLHTHAPQFSFRGTGMDLELLEWLYKYTFPEEARYESNEYASQSYKLFVDELIQSSTTRAVVFGTIFRESTMLLMEKLEQSGLITYVGKVNMDRNCPDYYQETAEQSLRETERFIENSERFHNTQPILTPRFIPVCSDELMRGLADIQAKTGIPIQSHLSENRNEIQWVKSLNPDSRFYGDAYDIFGLFGGRCRTVMAHCVSSPDEEISLMAERGVYVAHCPNSNMNLSSGIAPARKLLEHGIRVGLGSDLAAGQSINLFDEIVRAVQVSKLRWRYKDDTYRPISIIDAFYMATRGGGEFFGKVGSFDKGFDFDALVIDDSRLRSMMEMDDEARFHRSLYLSHECELCAKYVRGKKIRIRKNSSK